MITEYIEVIRRLVSVYSYKIFRFMASNNKISRFLVNKRISLSLLVKNI